MFRSNNNLFHSVPLGNTHNVASPTLVNHCADFSMITFMRHALLDAWIYLDDYVVSRFVLIEQIAETRFAPFSWFLS